MGNDNGAQMPMPSHVTQPGASEAPAVLDSRCLDAIRELQGPGESDLLQEVVAVYLEEGPRLLGAIRQAVQATDGEALRQAAHTLKSSSASLGATDLARLCQELEDHGRQDDIETAAALLHQLETDLGVVCRALSLSCERG